MIPRANSCAPLKIAMIEARNAKPGTTAAAVGRGRSRARSTRITNPNNVNRKPMMLAIWRGSVLKPGHHVEARA